MNKHLGVLIPVALAFAAGVLVTDTLQERRQQQFMKSLAKQCKADPATGYTAQVGYNPVKDTFGCIYLPDRSPSWAMAPVFSHPLKGTPQ